MLNHVTGPVLAHPQPALWLPCAAPWVGAGSRAQGCRVLDRRASHLAGCSGLCAFGSYPCRPWGAACCSRDMHTTSCMMRIAGCCRLCAACRPRVFCASGLEEMTLW